MTGDQVSDHLAAAVASTLARIAALREAEQQLELRRQAIRGMHDEDGTPSGEVFRLLNNELRDQGLTDQDLKDAGVSLHSIMKVLQGSR